MVQQAVLHDVQSYLGDLGQWTAEHDVFEAQSLRMLIMLRQNQNLNHIRVWKQNSCQPY